jgi:hypothetical protein
LLEHSYIQEKKRGKLKRTTPWPLVLQIVLSTRTDDQVTWTWTASGRYLSCYVPWILFHSQLLGHLERTTEKQDNCLCWLLVHQRILTAHKLHAASYTPCAGKNLKMLIASVLLAVLLIRFGVVWLNGASLILLSLQSTDQGQSNAHFKVGSILMFPPSIPRQLGFLFCVHLSAQRSKIALAP